MEVEKAVDESLEIPENIPSIEETEIDTKTFKVGTGFKSYDEFLVKFNDYCDENNVNFVQTESIKSKSNSDPFSEKLVYRVVRYCCNFHNEGTFMKTPDKRKCQAEVIIYADTSRKKLVISKLFESHTHPCLPVAESDTVSQMSRVFPLRSFARGPLPACIYQGNENEDYPRNLVSKCGNYEPKLKHRVKGKKRGRKPRKKSSKPTKQTLPNQKIDVECIRKPRTAHSNAVVRLHKICDDLDMNFPNELAVTDKEMDMIMEHLDSPAKQDKQTEKETTYTPDIPQSNHNQRTENVTPHTTDIPPPLNNSRSVIKNQVTLPTSTAITEMCAVASNCSSRIDADDLFFLSLSSEIKDLPRRGKLNVKLKIMGIVNDSLRIYSSR